MSRVTGEEVHAAIYNSIERDSLRKIRIVLEVCASRATTPLALRVKYVAPTVFWGLQDRTGVQPPVGGAFPLDTSLKFFEFLETLLHLLEVEVPSIEETEWQREAPLPTDNEYRQVILAALHVLHFGHRRYTGSTLCEFDFLEGVRKDHALFLTRAIKLFTLAESSPNASLEVLLLAACKD